MLLCRKERVVSASLHIQCRCWAGDGEDKSDDEDEGEEVCCRRHGCCQSAAYRSAAVNASGDTNAVPHVRESSWLWRDKSGITLVSECSRIVLVGAGVGRMGMVVG